jgi:hypothetical protein
MSKATVEDARLVLQFYEMRREPRMREARTFVIGSFKARTFEEFLKVCPLGSAENASFRQVTSYWDMVCAIVRRDLVDRDLFFETNGELTVVWEKVRELTHHYRERLRQPLFLANLEQIASEREAWLEVKMPGYLTALRERLGV